MSYPFWLKNQADNARNDAYDERRKKEETDKRLKNVEKVIEELKPLLEQGQYEGGINSEWYELLKKKIEEVQVK